jgi:flagellar biosynthesis component FlhA
MEETTQVLERREETKASPGSTRKLIRNVRSATRRKFTAEEKIRIVLEGFRNKVQRICFKVLFQVVVYTFCKTWFFIPR